MECLGELLPADVSVLQCFMIQCRVPLLEQMNLWRDFYQQLPDPAWAALCLEKAREIRHLLDEEAALFPPAVATALPPDPDEKPVGPTAERHFVWTGARHDIGVDPVRNGIARLAEHGLVSAEPDQQAAFRRCLGLAVNDQERSSDPPWTLWLGPSDMLRHLVEQLWRMELIYCPNGRRDKWHTLRGAFLHADRSRFPRSIKTDYCTNPEKLRLLDTHILTPLRNRLAT